MASNGWFRVAMGARKVAQAAAAHAAENGQAVAFKAVQHGSELGVTVRTAVMAAATSQQQWQTTTTTTTTSTTPPVINGDPPPPPVRQQQQQEEPRDAASQQQPSMNHDEESTTLSTQADNSIRITKESQNQEEVHTSDRDIITEEIIEEPITEQQQQQPVLEDAPYDRLQEGQRVPSSRVGRAFGFASLGVGLVVGTAAEAASRLIGGGTRGGGIVANDANADRLAATLCRMRGAALKMGQMLSIQDESLLPPALVKALNQVRQGADAMPKKQLETQLEAQLGENWRDRFDYFDELPFAAASIGQVHRAKAMMGGDQSLVVKVQYPGVANSIESDLNNLTMLVKMSGFAPKGLFIDNVIRVGRDELKVECNYLQEMENQLRFKELVETDPILSRERFVVPGVVSELTTAEILTTEYARGGTIDKVLNLDQDERDRVGRNIFYLTIQELFVWRFMQTDPNWGNFLYDVGSRTTTLIDFGAAREYSKSFVDGYLRIVWANANRDEETLMDLSHKMGFLTGEENDIMLDAHKQSGFTLGEPFATDEAFDFRGSEISSRLSAQSSAFMQHRLTPPPEEVYTLHRKLAGAFMLCIKLGARVKCRELLENVIRNHQFDDGMEPPRL